MAIDAGKVIGEMGPALARIAASYERNRALREELIQDIFLAVFKALPRLKDRDKLKPFVFRIAHNRAMSHITRRMREPPGDANADTISHDTPTQEAALIASQQSARLLEAVRRLTLPYRQVITLVLEDLSYPEIADVLGITEVNVGVRINRAKDQLRRLLSDDR
jgi:RNA polymerase sigma factor (sigma-70 family)